MQDADSSELMRKIEELRSDLALLQGTIDGQKDTLIFSIDLDYRYRSFNECFKAATAGAYGTEVVRGLSLLESIPLEEDRDKAKKNIDRAMNGEAHVTIEEYGGLRTLIYETHYSPIYNHSREIIGVSVLSSDVTQRVLSEQRVKTLNAELESFTYMAAHDLRVPLRLIDGYANILSEDYGDRLDENGHRLLAIINRQAVHMARLIDDLLAFARLGNATLAVRETSMRDVIQQVVDVVIIERGDDRVKVHIGNILPCQCDPALIRTAFTNLVSNAVKFSSKEANPLVEISSERKGTSVTYAIRDNGVGFDMKYSGKLFGLFQRLHKPTEFDGTGVGLAIVQRIIGKHGGKVWFEAELGKGATFYVSLLA